MGTQIIEVSALRKRYGGKVAVEDVSFTVDQGEIFGIVGPNGAGKRRRPCSGPGRLGNGGKSCLR